MGKTGGKGMGGVPSWAKGVPVRARCGLSCGCLVPVIGNPDVLARFLTVWNAEVRHTEEISEMMRETGLGTSRERTKELE